MGATVSWWEGSHPAPLVFTGEQAATSPKLSGLSKTSAMTTHPESRPPNHSDAEALTPCGKWPPQRGSRQNAGLSRATAIPPDAL